METLTCTLCNHSYTQEIPATNVHNYVDGVCTVCNGTDPNYQPSTDGNNGGTNGTTTETTTETTTQITEQPAA